MKLDFLCIGSKEFNFGSGVWDNKKIRAGTLVVACLRPLLLLDKPQTVSYRHSDNTHVCAWGGRSGQWVEECGPEGGGSGPVGGGSGQEGGGLAQWVGGQAQWVGVWPSGWGSCPVGRGLAQWVGECGPVGGGSGPVGGGSGTVGGIPHINGVETHEHSS